MEKNQEIPIKILDRMKKLKALAEKPGSREEGETAMAMLNKLLIEYNVSLGTVDAYKVEEKNVINEKYDLNDYQGRHDAGWASKLINGLSHFNFCRVINHNHSETHWREKYDQGAFTIIGQKHNVEICMYMFDYCINHIKILHKAAWKLYMGDEKTNTFRRGFYQGCIKTLVERLEDMRQQQREQVNAIIKVNDLAVDNKVKELFPRLGRCNASKGLISQAGRAAGMEAGHKLNLAQGLSGKSSNTHQLK